MGYNQDAWRMVEEKVTEVATSAANTAASAATQGLVKGKADTLPTSADFVGQLFIKTGTTNPGLYSATGTTTPGWTLVALSS